MGSLDYLDCHTPDGARRVSFEERGFIAEKSTLDMDTLMAPIMTLCMTGFYLTRMLSMPAERTGPTQDRTAAYST